MTFKLPLASATASGLVTAAAQTFGGVKTFGNGIVVTQGTPQAFATATGGACVFGPATGFAGVISHTFRGAIGISGNIAGTEYIANSVLIDNNAGTSRIFSAGINATTNGTFQLNSARSDGSNAFAILNTDVAGAMTLGNINARGGSGYAGISLVGRTNGALSTAGDVGEFIESTPSQYVGGSTAGTTVATLTSVKPGHYLATLTIVSVNSSGAPTDVLVYGELTTIVALSPNSTTYFNPPNNAAVAGSAAHASGSFRICTSKTIPITVSGTTTYYVRAGCIVNSGQIGIQAYVLLTRIG